MLRSVGSAWRTRAKVSPANKIIQKWSVAQLQAYTQSPRCWQDVASSHTTSDDVQPNGGGKREHLNRLPVFCLGTVTTVQPHATSIADLLSQLSNFKGPPSGGKGTHGRPALLCLLLTPSYAQHALDNELPLKAYEQLSPGGTSKRPLHGFTAVVDRLPAYDSNEVKEGLSYAYMRVASDYDFELPPVGEASQEFINMDGPKPGTLSFKWVSAQDKAQTYKLQLPLAQTIFSTGQVSTMLHTYFAPDDQNRLRFKSQEQLNGLTLRLPFTGNEYRRNTGMTHSVTAHFPLIPLTPARKVKDIMGNIVRTLSSHPTNGPHRLKPGDNDTFQPASQELETAISTYFKTHELDPQPVTVYALVISHLSSTVHAGLPKNVRALLQHDANSRGPGPRTLDEAIRNLLQMGKARLCRVLSGGGGWGKKAGLLSLDPEVEYSGQTKGPSEAGLKEALSGVVKEGDSIMFFVAPSQVTSAGATASTDRDNIQRDFGGLSPQPRYESAVFGSLPSSIDSVSPIPDPISDKNVADSHQPSQIQHHPRLFGMLSEGGMALSVTNSKSGDIILQTKLSAPYSRVSIGPPEDLEQQTKAKRVNLGLPPLQSGDEERSEKDWYASASSLDESLDRRMPAKEPVEDTQGFRKALEYSKGSESDTAKVEDLFAQFGGATEEPESPKDPRDLELSEEKIENLFKEFKSTLGNQESSKENQTRKKAVAMKPWGLDPTAVDGSIRTVSTTVPHAVKLETSLPTHQGNERLWAAEKHAQDEEEQGGPPAPVDVKKYGFGYRFEDKGGYKGSEKRPEKDEEAQMPKIKKLSSFRQPTIKRHDHGATIRSVYRDAPVGKAGQSKSGRGSGDDGG